MAEVSMNDILADDKPDPVVADVADVADVAEVPNVESTPVEKPLSKKVAHRDKEQLAQGRVRDPETGQYAPKVEVTVEPEAPVKAEVVKPVQQEFTEKEKAFLRAAQEERGKRQELERKIAAGEYSKAPAALPAAGAEAPKTFWDDPEAALNKHRAEIRAEVQAEAHNASLKTSEFIARQKYTDFDEKVAVFGTIVQQTPGLYQQWLASPDLAEFAYGVAKNHMELKQAGDLPALRAKIERETEARVRATIETEMKAKADALAKERSALPGSLSAVRSSGVNRPVWGGVPDFDNILKG